MNRFQPRFAGFAITMLLIVSRHAQAVTISTVVIGNAGNPMDTRYTDFFHPNGVGSVAQAFNIGTTEVTNAQYLQFLNAVAKADPEGLYDTNMNTDSHGGIIRSGNSGSYAYTLKAPAQNGAYTYGDKPVVYVDSGDAMRFINWLHNGQPTGAENTSTTEDGAYALRGAVSNQTLAAVTRKAGARWWLPTDDEWYKAAYHKNDGVTGNYWDYPTASNTTPNHNLPSSDTGNSANFLVGNYTTGNYDYSLTNAGAYSLSDSPYGTFDQAGNIEEWTETLYFDQFRGVRGGSWQTGSNFFHASGFAYSDPTNAGRGRGFRVATVAVPEPSAFLLALAAMGALKMASQSPARLRKSHARLRVARASAAANCMAVVSSCREMSGPPRRTSACLFEPGIQVARGLCTRGIAVMWGSPGQTKLDRKASCQPSDLSSD
jgi:sulfatase modifying factor 1